jgi:hypothetical protein
MLKSNLTAFPRTEQRLREMIKTVDMDRIKKEVFPACSFLSAQCFGVCCSFKVAVTNEEAETLKAIVKENTAFFRHAICHIPDEIIKTGTKLGQRYLTRRKRDFKELNRIIYALISDGKRNKIATLKDFFSFLHVCAFSMKDGGCSLQRLALEKGLHKWYYKPINCWKFPLTIRDGILTMPKVSNYVRLPCSYQAKNTAITELHEELSFLGKIIGREITQ